MNKEINFDIENGLPSLIDGFLNRSFSDVIGADFTSNIPSANIIETENEFTIELAIPGFEKKDIEVQLDKDKLIVQSIKEEHTEDKTDAKFTRREFNYKSFKRSFNLPKTVNKSKIEAKYKQGVLSIKLAKKEEAIDLGPQKVSIK